MSFVVFPQRRDEIGVSFDLLLGVSHHAVTHSTREQGLDNGIGPGSRGYHLFLALLDKNHEDKENDGSGDKDRPQDDCKDDGPCVVIFRAKLCRRIEVQHVV